MPVVIKEIETENYYVSEMSWGLVLSWQKNGKDIKLINSRSDTLMTKPSFKRKLEFQRCLIPATGFYEWDHIKGKRLPYYFSLKNKAMFSFAGIYEKDTYSIITTDANDIVCTVHNRMPVIISREDETKWLSPDINDEEIYNLLLPFPEDKMKAYSVSTKVNQVSIDSPDLIKPFLYE
jgi:putative SOS response-associated peptidase YedK